MSRHPLKRRFRQLAHRLAMLRWRLGIETTRDREQRGRIDRALAELPETERKIFLMARRDDLSLVEIAGQLGIAVPETQARFAHAMEQLDRALSG